MFSNACFNVRKLQEIKIAGKFYPSWPLAVWFSNNMPALCRLGDFFSPALGCRSTSQRRRRRLAGDKAETPQYRRRKLCPRGHIFHPAVVLQHEHGPQTPCLNTSLPFNLLAPWQRLDGASPMWPASLCAIPRHRELSEPHLTGSQAQGRNKRKAMEGGRLWKAPAAAAAAA